MCFRLEVATKRIGLLRIHNPIIPIAPTRLPLHKELNHSLHYLFKINLLYKKLTLSKKIDFPSKFASSQ